MFDIELIKQTIASIHEEIKEAKETFGVDLPVELLGKQACHSGLAYNSASRNQMTGGNFASAIVIDNPTRRKTITGHEFEFSKTTWKVEAPEDMVVLSVYDYQPSVSKMGQLPAELRVTYHSAETGAVGCLRLPVYKKYHEMFGTKLVPTEDYHRIERGAKFTKGTVFLKSPTVDDDGFWRFGRQLMGAATTDPSGIEDGIRFSKSACKKISYKTQGSIKLVIGEDILPLNLYGNKFEYKIFPDVGEKVGEDRIIAAFRRSDPMSEMCSSTPKSLSREGIRFDSDKVFYLRPGEHDAVITSVEVHYQPNPSRPATPRGIEAQLMRYAGARTRTSIRALKELSEFERKGEVFDPKYHNFSVENISNINVLSDQDLGQNGLKYYNDIKAKKMVGSSVLSEWHVVIHYESQMIPNYGQKVTGCSGNKSTITSIVEDDEMYMDKDGNRCDFSHDVLSIIKRTNSFALYEPGLNAFLRDVSKHALEAIGFERNPTPEQVEKIKSLSLEDGQYELVFSLMDAYLSCGLIIHRLHLWEDLEINPNSYKENIRDWLLEEYQFNEIPINNPYPLPIILKSFLDEFGDVLVLDKVRFKHDGKWVESKGNILLSSVYMMVLDKPGTDYQAVGSSATNHYGIAAKLPSAAKQQAPIRLQPTRTHGESEERVMAGVNDDGTGLVHASINDYSDNPLSHALQIKTIIEDPLVTPEVAVDRDIVPLGGSNPASMTRHMLSCMGLAFDKDEITINNSGDNE